MSILFLKICEIFFQYASLCPRQPCFAGVAHVITHTGLEIASLYVVSFAFGSKRGNCGLIKKGAPTGARYAYARAKVDADKPAERISGHEQEASSLPPQPVFSAPAVPAKTKCWSNQKSKASFAITKTEMTTKLQGLAHAPITKDSLGNIAIECKTISSYSINRNCSIGWQATNKLTILNDIRFLKIMRQAQRARQYRFEESI
jgi:hypothetical protein